MSPYTLDELYILYGYLKEETGHYCRMIRRKLIICNRENNTEKLYEWLYYSDLKFLFQMPLEEVPLHINDERKHVQIVMKWRLEVAR
jgi:hypothetical protein